MSENKQKPNVLLDATKRAQLVVEKSGKPTPASSSELALVDFATAKKALCGEEVSGDTSKKILNALQVGGTDLVVKIFGDETQQQGTRR